VNELKRALAWAREHRVAAVLLALLFIGIVGAIANAGSHPAATQTPAPPVPSATVTAAPVATADASPTASRSPSPKPRRKHRRRKVTQPLPAPTTQAPPPATTAPPPSCYPISDEGTCYEPGEYCRDSDHGVSGIAGDGKPITCEDNDGWRWEPS
jgi:hypothetical protein